MEIVKAKYVDLDSIMDIYKSAREFMKMHGNVTQWGDDHPPREMIEKDIEKGQSYICIEEGKIESQYLLFVASEQVLDISTLSEHSTRRD